VDEEEGPTQHVDQEVLTEDHSPSEQIAECKAQDILEADVVPETMEEHLEEHLDKASVADVQDAENGGQGQNVAEAAVVQEEIGCLANGAAREDGAEVAAKDGGWRRSSCNDASTAEAPHEAQEERQATERAEGVDVVALQERLVTGATEAAQRFDDEGQLQQGGEVVVSEEDSFTNDEAVATQKDQRVDGAEYVQKGKNKSEAEITAEQRKAMWKAQRGGGA